MSGNFVCAVGNFKTFTKETLCVFVIEKAIYSKDINLIGNDRYKLCDAIQFSRCTMYAFPNADSIKLNIPNLTVLSINNCKLSKITCADLQGYACLKELYLQQCEIEYLPCDLFKHTPDLEVISFNLNKIKYIDKKILDPLRNLKIFDVYDNVNINAKYDTINNRGNVTLEQLKNEIKTKCKRTSDLWAKYDNQQKDVSQLKAELVYLRSECKTQQANINSMKTNTSNLKRTCTELTKEKKILKEKVKESEAEICRVKKVSKIQQKEIRVLKLQLKKSRTSKAVQLKQNKIFKTKISKLERNFELMSKQFRMVKEVSKDFTVNVGLKGFKVHKALLIANSKVLEELINANPNIDSLELDDVSQSTFQHILNFIVDEISPPAEANLIELFGACCQLKIQNMIPIVKGLLMEKVNLVNALDVLFLCKNMEGYHEDLKEKAFDEFKQNLPNQYVPDELASQPDQLKKILEAKHALDKMLLVN